MRLKKHMRGAIYAQYANEENLTFHSLLNGFLFESIALKTLENSVKTDAKLKGKKRYLHKEMCES